MQAWIRAQPDFEAPTSSTSRIPALYADLAAHRQANQSSFKASVAWWKETLSQASLDGRQRGQTAKSNVTKHASEASKDTSPLLAPQSDRLVLHVNQQLLDDLTLDDVGRPLGIGTVIRDMQDTRDLVRLPAFLISKVPIEAPKQQSRSITSSLASVALYPLTWATSQLSSSLGLGHQDEDPGEHDWNVAQGDWVLCSNVCALGNAILKLHHSTPRLSPLECLYSKQEFRDKLVGPALRSLVSDSSSAVTALSDRDYDVLVRNLVRDRRVAIADGSLVKLEHREGEGVGDANSITEAERGIVNVKMTHSQLEKQVEEIERRIKERQAKVEECLREKRREQALSYLRSRKTLEELLQRRMGSLETLHGVLVKIEQAASDAEIVKAYEVSTSTLKMLLSDARLQPERIDATMDNMQEALADADEVRTAIDTGNEGMRRAAGVPDIDDQEMQDELAILQREVEAEHQSKESDAQIESAPSSTAQPAISNAPTREESRSGQMEKNKSQESSAEALPAQ